MVVVDDPEDTSIFYYGTSSSLYFFQTIPMTTIEMPSSLHSSPLRCFLAKVVPDPRAEALTSSITESFSMLKLPISAGFLDSRRNVPCFELQEHSSVRFGSLGPLNMARGTRRSFSVWLRSKDMALITSSS